MLSHAQTRLADSANRVCACGTGCKVFVDGCSGNALSDWISLSSIALNRLQPEPSLCVIG